MSLLFRVQPVVICCLLGLTGIARADLILSPDFENSAGETWDSVRTGVINQAIMDWQGVIGGVLDTQGSVQTVGVDFTVNFATAGDTYLGQWSGSFTTFNGNDVRPWDSFVEHTITFNADFFNGDSSSLWWDPSPDDDGSDKAFADWDALTVARHEIGHMLGFTSLYRDDFNTGIESNPWTDLIEGDVFDPTGLNVSMEPGDPAHVLVDELLMDTELSNAEGRIGISNTELGMLSKAYGYSVTAIPEPSGGLALLWLAMLRLSFVRSAREFIARAR